MITNADRDDALEGVEEGISDAPSWGPSARSSVDLSLIKKGDEVTVRAEFLATNPFGNVEIRVLGPGGRPITGHVDPFAIVSHQPKPLAVGDRVKAKAWTNPVLRILCIHGAWAWLTDDEGSTVQEPLSDLERVS